MTVKIKGLKNVRIRDRGLLNCKPRTLDQELHRSMTTKSSENPPHNIGRDLQSLLPLHQSMKSHKSVIGLLLSSASTSSKFIINL